MYVFFVQVFILITIFLAVAMGKDIGRVYKYSQRNWTYPSPNTKLIKPYGFLDSKL